MKKIKKDIINYTLTAILIVSILMIYVSKLALNTLLSKQYVLSKLDETSYNSSTSFESFKTYSLPV